MIALIDPKRQEELENIIVELKVQVNSLANEVQRLRELNTRNQRDIQKVHREVQDSFRSQTTYNPWEAMTATNVDEDATSALSRFNRTIIGTARNPGSDYDTWTDTRRVHTPQGIEETMYNPPFDSWMRTVTMHTPINSVSRFGGATGTCSVVADVDF